MKPNLEITERGNVRRSRTIERTESKDQIQRKIARFQTLIATYQEELQAYEEILEQLNQRETPPEEPPATE